jgi:transcriptional regulator with XRE-family HTH domain
VKQSRNKLVPVHTLTPVTLGAYIRAARERAELSQRELASLAGFHHSMLARLESDKVAEPKPDNLQRLADALKIDSAGLLAFVGVKLSVPEPKVFFRRAYGMNEDEAAEAERVIAELRTHMREKGASRTTTE